jgi:hypothetical protein
MGRRAVGIPRGPFFWRFNTAWLDANFPLCFGILLVEAVRGGVRLRAPQTEVSSMQML